jgi:hypothetical protein
VHRVDGIVGGRTHALRCTLDNSADQFIDDLWPLS